MHALYRVGRSQLKRGHNSAAIKKMDILNRIKITGIPIKSVKNLLRACSDVLVSSGLNGHLTPQWGQVFACTEIGFSHSPQGFKDIGFTEKSGRAWSAGFCLEQVLWCCPKKHCGLPSTMREGRALCPRKILRPMSFVPCALSLFRTRHHGISGTKLQVLVQQVSGFVCQRQNF